MVGVAVHLVLTPLLGCPQAHLFQERPRYLQPLIAAIGDDALAVPFNHFCNGQPRQPGPPRSELSSLAAGHFPREDRELHSQGVDAAVHWGHTNDFGGPPPVLHGGLQSAQNKGPSVHVAY